jgi:putative two-component system response regulator
MDADSPPASGGNPPFFVSRSEGVDIVASEGVSSAGRVIDVPSLLAHPEHLRDVPIVIVDDQPSNVALISALLRRAGFTNLHGTTRPQELFALLDRVRPCLLLLDLHMPGLDGFAVMQRLRERQPTGEFLPILVLTADTSPDARRRALAGGAHDILTKPFDLVEVQLRVSNLLRTQALYAALQQQNSTLEQQVRERTDALERSRLETLQTLALAAEFRDDITGQHTRRVGRLAAAIGQTLGLAPGQVDLLRRAAPLHDLGKIGIPDHVLLKPGWLTPDEFTVMKRHTTIGFEIMAASESTTLRLAGEIALTHHERWDGLGYREGIGGERIPLEGRIVAVADAFDAITHDRPYREARSIGDALQEIEREAGRQFDPHIAYALIETIATYEGMG